MVRLFVSTVIGVLIGVGIGLYYGYEVNPIVYNDSPIADLAPRHQDEYTLMIASAYLVDGSVSAAIQRLSALGVENVPAYVQETAERFITNSRNVNDIRKIVALAEGLGRLTPPMENFRQFSLNGGGA